MHVGVGGYSPGAEDDPFVILGAVLDQPFLPGPINKNRREDLQLWSLLQALAAAGAVRHPLAVRSRRGPSDRYLAHGSRVWDRDPAKSFIRSVAAERALRVTGVVAVGRGDVVMAVQAQEADGQATC